VYVAARGVEDQWNTHFRASSYPLYDRLIQNMIANMDVDPNRVYIMGYSAGGDGVYQITPNMADRFAATNMSAGHPNGINELNLKNVAFQLQVGEIDEAYDRYLWVSRYDALLDALGNEYGGYEHRAFVHDMRQHSYVTDRRPQHGDDRVMTNPQAWLAARESADRVYDSLRDDTYYPPDWMQGVTRDPLPSEVIWNLGTRADQRTVESFYWLSAPMSVRQGLVFAHYDRAKNLVVLDTESVRNAAYNASRKQVVWSESTKGAGFDFEVLLNEEMIDFSQPVTFVVDGAAVCATVVPSRAVLEQTTNERGDPNYQFEARVSYSELKALAAHTLTATTAKAATCTAAGNSAYWTCSGCGKYFSDATGTVEIAANSWVVAATGHSWGDWVVTKAATETTKGEETRTCQNDSSHKETRELPKLVHTHTLTATTAKAATCTTAGNSAYWTCSGCGKHFSDANGTKEIAANSWVIAATGHSWGNWVVTKAATEDEAGEETRTCRNDSSHKETRELPRLVHTHTLTATAAKAATCTAAGNSAYWTCSGCGKHFSDADGTTEIAANSWVVAATGHSWGDWVVTKAATEDEVGVETRTCRNDAGHKETRELPKLVHTHTLTATTAKATTCTAAGNSAYWTCSGCGKHFSDADGTTEIAANSWVVAATGHSWGDWVVTKAATETAKGEETRTCQNDASHKETRELPKLAHTHTLTATTAKAATCTAAGNSAYWTCSGCGKHFSDADGATEIAANSWVVAATGHSWGDWVVTKAATEDEAGEETRTCQNDASHKETRELPRLDREIGSITYKNPLTDEDLASSNGGWYVRRAGRDVVPLDARDALLPNDFIFQIVTFGDAERSFDTANGQLATVTIPYAGWNSGCKLQWLNGSVWQDDGTVISWTDASLTFTTTHFSTWRVTDADAPHFYATVTLGPDVEDRYPTDADEDAAYGWTAGEGTYLDDVGNPINDLMPGDTFHVDVKSSAGFVGAWAYFTFDSTYVELTYAEVRDGITRLVGDDVWQRLSGDGDVTQRVRPASARSNG
jgi:transposase-like protein